MQNDGQTEFSSSVLELEPKIILNQTSVNKHELSVVKDAKQLEAQNAEQEIKSSQFPVLTVATDDEKTRQDEKKIGELQREKGPDFTFNAVSVGLL